MIQFFYFTALTQNCELATNFASLSCNSHVSLPPVSLFLTTRKVKFLMCVYKFPCVFGGNTHEEQFSRVLLTHGEIDFSCSASTPASPTIPLFSTVNQFVAIATCLTSSTNRLTSNGRRNM
jgi:hypothetical protein